jgi:thiaminase
LTVRRPGEWVYRNWTSAAVPPPVPVYRRGGDLHATPRFQGFVDWMRDERDALARSRMDEALVERRFIQVVAFEARFWSEAPR